jgi:hypothetical protein
MRLPVPVRFVIRGLVAALVIAAPVPSATAQDKKQADQAEQAQRAEAQSLVTLVEDLASGKTPQSSLPFKWEQNHFIKAQADKTYVPFTLAFEPGAVTTTGVGVYLRVMKKGAAPEPPPPADTGKKKDKDKAPEVKSHYPFEDLFFIDLPAVPAGQPQRLRRAFAVAPGEYDVYIAVKEREGSSAPATATSSTGPAGTAGAAPASLKMGVIKQDLTVLDLSTDFTTSSIIVADKVDVLQAPLPADQQATNPYTFGQMKITPAPAETKFSKKGELSIIFWIYGAGSDATTKKPDVTIDFKFNRKNGDNYEYFNKTEPQQLNAQTLPPTFDLAAGHQLPGSLAVPLASFPEGDYRLDIEVTDKTAGKTLKRDVTFTVVP